MDHNLEMAQHFYEIENWELAFVHFLLYFKFSNDRSLRSQFIYTLISLTTKLTEDEKCTYSSDYYFKQALICFPRDSEILMNYFLHLLNLHHNKAICIIKQELPEEFSLDENVRDILIELVPRWHFRMVNDRLRNKAYYDAITAFKCNVGLKILDLGSGCGLLSLFASNNSQVNTIIAVEENTALSIVSRSIFEENKTNVTLINDKSNNLNEQDIDGRVDLIVTEIFDCAVFGEHALSSLIHAHDNLLKPNGKIIPSNAIVYVTGIECEELSRMYKIQTDVLNLNSMCIVSNDDDYDAVDLRMMEWKAVTETISTVVVDFNNNELLKELYNKEMSSFKLKCVEDGVIHAFAVWFDLNLNENTTITTNPRVENVKCWEQGICFVDPYDLKKDDLIEIDYTCKNNATAIKIKNKIDSNDTSFKVDKCIITFLNDSTITNTIVQLSKEFKNRDNLKILDLNLFPLFALLLAMDKNVCYCKRREETLIKSIMEINNISENNLIFVDDIEEFLNSNKDLDIILIDAVTKYGILSVECINNLELYRSCLKPNGVLLPRRIDLIGEIIECESLFYNCKAYDDNAMGFKVSAHLNMFSVDEHWRYYRKTPRKRVSETFRFKDLKENSLQNKKVKVAQTGRADGILYEFDLFYSDNLCVNTFNSPFYNVASYLCNERSLVQENTLVNVLFELCYGNVRLQMQ